MILQELHRLAHDHQLVGDPDFESKPVRWTIVLDEQGALASVICMDVTPPAEAGAKKKPRPRSLTTLVPMQFKRQGIGFTPFFMVDTSGYALGWEPGGDEKKQARAEEAVRAFAELVNACAHDTNDPAAIAVAAFLKKRLNHKSGTEWIAERFKGHEVQGNDLCAFQVGDTGKRFVHERKAVKQWWKEHRAAKRGDSSSIDPDASTACLITGAPVASSSLVPQVNMNRWGGNSAGSAIVSFNNPAFMSYGLNGSDNAPVSPLAAEAAITALRRLLARDGEAQDADGKPLPAWNFTLADDTVVTFWSDHPPLASAMPGIFEAIWEEAQQDAPEDVRRVYGSVFKGSPFTVDNAEQFRALTLTGSQGRVIVRGFIQQSVPHTIESLRRHFEDLDIVRNYRQNDDRSPSHFKLRDLVEAIAGPQPTNKKSEGVHKALSQQFLEAALDSSRLYPHGALVRAVERWRAEFQRDGRFDADLRDARAAMIKACLNRESRVKNLARPEITKHMDPSNKNPAYRLGCLMAVYERLQQDAHTSPKSPIREPLNSTVIDRYFRAASATPNAVFKRLEDLSIAHLKKSQREWGLRHTIYFKRLIDAQLQACNATDGIPKRFTLDEQSLFILGYHQMRHWLWAGPDEKSQWRKEYPDAPALYGKDAKPEFETEEPAPV